MRANGVRDGHANENGVHNGHANGVTRNGISNGGRGGGGRGPATSALKGPPPVPLLQRRARTTRRTAADASRNGGGGGARARRRGGGGGMRGASRRGRDGHRARRRSEDDEAHEHGYAPASSEEYAEGFGSPGGSVDARLGERDGGGAPARFDGDAAPLAPGSGGFARRATGTSARAAWPRRGVLRLQPRPRSRSAARARRARRAECSRLPIIPRAPRRAAPRPHFSRSPGRKPAGPASGTVSGGGHLGPARSNGGAFPGPATDANGAANMGQTRSASVGRVSMQKNGPPAMARAVVDDGGDESEEDGEAALPRTPRMTTRGKGGRSNGRETLFASRGTENLR